MMNGYRQMLKWEGSKERKNGKGWQGRGRARSFVFNIGLLLGWHKRAVGGLRASLTGSTSDERTSEKRRGEGPLAKSPVSWDLLHHSVSPFAVKVEGREASRAGFCGQGR